MRCKSTYVYDSANQLIRENNNAGGFTHTWTYDNAGNITSRKEYGYTTGDLETPNNVVSYTYPVANEGEDIWGDLLLLYNGKGITYDDVGNPTNDGTWDYTWEHGRQLASKGTEGRFSCPPAKTGAVLGDTGTVLCLLDNTWR